MSDNDTIKKASVIAEAFFLRIMKRIFLIGEI